MDFGAEHLGHCRCRGHLLARVDVDTDGDNNAFQIFMEVKAFADGQYRDGGFLYDAYSGTAHPVFLESRGTVGTDNYHGGILVAGFAGYHCRHTAGTDIPAYFAGLHSGLILFANLFQLVFGKQGHHRLLFFVHQQFLTLGPYYFYVTMDFVGDVGRQFQSHE